MTQAPAANRSTASSLRLHGWLVLAVLGMLVLFAVLTWFFWLPSWIQTPRTSIGTITKRRLDGTLLIAINGLVLYGLYAVGALFLWRMPTTTSHHLTVWTGAIAACAILLWSYPVTSTDIFDYFFRSRMSLVYDANPYINLPNQYKNDQFLRYIGWPNAPSAYGPLWEYLSALLIWTTGSSLLASVVGYKLISAVTHLACGALIAKLIEVQQLKTLGAYLWLLNPLVLWELVAIGHNDGLMVLALLLALLAVRSNLHWLAILVLTAGALVKFLPAIFLPLVVLDWMRHQSTWRERTLRCIAALMIVALPTIFLYAPFWDLPVTWSQLGLQDKFAAIWKGRSTTLRNLAVREGFLNASPLAVISYILQTPPSVSTINNLLRTFGLPLADKADVRSVISSLGTMLLAGGLLWQAWHVWFRRRPLQAAFLGLLFWYVLGSSQWFQPWYIVWIVAIAAVRPNKREWQWLTVWALMAQSSYLLQYIVLPNWKLSGQTLEAQALYLVVIYALPALVWLGTWYTTRRQHGDPEQRQPNFAVVP